MRPALAILLAATLSLPAFAQQPAPKPAAPTGSTGAQPVQPANRPVTPAMQSQAGTPAVPNSGATSILQPDSAKPAPTPVPVPDGPVVNKQELEGGLLVEDIKIGTGAELKPGGSVVAFYHGTLKSDGSVFDSAFERGEPVFFPLANVIPGWQKGLPGMKVGGVRRLTIPAAMAYGANSRPKIPANSDLVFVVQLVDVLHVEDIKEGEGEAAESPFFAVTRHSYSDENGKPVGTPADAAHPYIWIANEWPAQQAGMEGMKVGGKRRIHIPKEANTPGRWGDAGRPVNVPLEMEVELVVLRNMQRRPMVPPTPIVPNPPKPATGATGTPAPTGAAPGGGH